MNTIAYEIDEKKTELQFPGSIAEMNGEQLIAAARHILSGGDIPDGDLAILTGLPADVVPLLSPFQLFSIRQMFDFLHTSGRDDLNFKEWKIDTISVDGEQWYGPLGNFANITWEEFVYIDQCFINGLHQAMVAAMFRPERDGYNGETDRRIPFTAFGTSNRFSKLDGCDPAVITAILLNYCAMRRASLETAYPQIFPQGRTTDPSDDDTEADFTDEAVDESTGTFSWTKVHRNLMGDNIQDEDKYLRLNVHTVLYRLNRLITENRKHN